MQMSYYCDKLVETVEKLLTLWLEDLIEKNIPLSQVIICDKAKPVFDDF